MENLELVGPFELVLSEEAQLVDPRDIPRAKRQVLAHDISIDPDTHDVYLFFLAPKIILNPKMKKRMQKRKSFSKVDRILVRTELPTKEMKILGMYPVTRTTAGEHVSTLIHDLPISQKLRPQGKTKDAIKRMQHMILTTRTQNSAEWWFLKPYIEQRIDFGMKLLCIVPKSIDEESRYFRCYVAAQDKGRIIEQIAGKRIHLPSA